MDKTILGQTIFEQMPPEYKSGEHRHERKPWFFIIIICLLIIFGVYWLYEKGNLPAPTPVSTPPSVSTKTPVPAPVAETAPTPSDDIADIQASAINTSIADFSTVF